MLLVFVPGAKTLNAAVRAEHGLHTLMPSGPIHREVQRGPDGAGIMVAENLAGAAERLQFNESLQSWSPRFGLSSFVGHWNDAKPSPTTLARQSLVDGERVQLLDGQDWQVPRLRKWIEQDERVTHTTPLPRVLKQDPDSGHLVSGPVVPEYRELWEQSLTIAQQLLDQAAGTGAASLDDEQLNAFVVGLLQTNYKIDLSVLSHLELLSMQHFSQVVYSALDWQTLQATLQKQLSRRTSGGMNTESGATPPNEA